MLAVHGNKGEGKLINHSMMTINSAQDRPGATMCQLDITKDLAFRPAYNNNSWFAFGRYQTGGHTINVLFHALVEMIGPWLR